MSDGSSRIHWDHQETLEAIGGPKDAARCLYLDVTRVARERTAEVLQLVESNVRGREMIGNYSLPKQDSVILPRISGPHFCDIV